MSVTTTVVKGPLSLTNPPSIVSTNPILSWYTKYAVDFSIGKTTTSPTKYYASNATLVNTDRSIICGAGKIWDYYIDLYGQFERCTHDKGTESLHNGYVSSSYVVSLWTNFTKDRARHLEPIFMECVKAAVNDYWYYLEGEE